MTRAAHTPQVEQLPGMEDGPVEAVAIPPAEKLSDEQELAVSRRAESLLLSAAAGSGKTSVLVERFVRAVRDDGVAPASILAITFTERAAGELRARVRARLLELDAREAARETEAAFVGTFHGFCARLLRAHPLLAGVDPDYRILDDGQAGRLRERAFAAALGEELAGEGESGEQGETVDVLAAYGLDRVRTMIEQVYAELRSRGQSLPRLPTAPDGDAQGSRACVLLDRLLERFGLAYEQLKRDGGAVDFDDLELVALELLQSQPALRAAWSERFELLMVDEFQDTNPRQLGILTALDRGNLFTVGDERQSIYGFRHADVSLFRSRRARLQEHGASLRLSRNYRSREPLLDVVNVVFAERFPDQQPLVAGRPGAAGAERELRTRSWLAPGDPGEREVELLLSDTRGWEEHAELCEAIDAGLPHAQTWRQAEARLLAARVAALVQGGHARAGDVVVLLRASGDLEVFERALQLCGLRTLASVGAFWGHQQIRDLTSYLRALANPLDEESLYATLASPLAGCSRDCLALLAGGARATRRAAWEVALDASTDEGELGRRLAPEDRRALSAFCGRLHDERRMVMRRTLSELIERAIEQSGYRAHVLALEWGERRLANVHKLLRLARRFEAREGRDLRAFVEHVGHLEQAVQAEPDAPVDGVEPDAVRLMTIHAAKGLEFPVVCVADLGRQPNTYMPDLLVDGDRVGLRLAHLDGSKPTATLDYEDLCRERREREAEEEDRVLYVAMTRARERLLLSGALDFERWAMPSQSPTAIGWLASALAPDLTELTRAGGATYDLPVGAGGSVHVRCRLNTPANAAGLLLAEDLDEASIGGPATLAPAPEPPADEPVHTRREAPARTRVSGRPGPAMLSYTSLSELERCGYRYYLERVLRLPEDASAATADVREGRLQARVRGTLIHRLMELLDFRRPSTSPERVAQVADELRLQVGEDECAEIATLLARAVESPLLARLAGADAVDREYAFAFSPGDEEPLMNGVVDVLARGRDGRCLIIDYKSDRVGVTVDLEELTAREYGLQRLVYALAVLRAGASEVEVVHWYLERPGEAVGVRQGAGERPRLEELLRRRISEARSRGFAVSEQPHRGLCLTCPGRGSLCSWSEQETMREQPARGLPDGACAERSG